MATPAYVPIDPNAPAGATQAPPAYSASDLANVRALRDAVVCGFVPGYSFTAAGASPPSRTWMNPATSLRFRATYTYDAVQTWIPTVVAWAWSNDAGATYQPMDATPATISWGGDGTFGIFITGVDRDAGLWVMALQAMVAAQATNRLLALHTANTGTSVHGLGTMATQHANAVAIVGGTTQNVTGTNNAENNLINQSKRREYPRPPFVLGSSGAWDWSATGGHEQIAPGANITIANAQVGEIKRLYVTGPGAITLSNGAQNIYWAVGHPVFGATVTLVNLCCVSTNTILATTTRL